MPNFVLDDRDVAGALNRIQMGSRNELREPMCEALERIVAELPEELSRIAASMQHVVSGMSFEVTETDKVSDGCFHLLVKGTKFGSTEPRERHFLVLWAGDKSPAYFDLLMADRAAWNGGVKFLYEGLTDGTTLARNIAIGVYGAQVPGTALCRSAGKKAEE